MEISEIWHEEQDTGQWMANGILFLSFRPVSQIGIADAPTLPIKPEAQYPSHTFCWSRYG